MLSIWMNYYQVTVAQGAKRDDELGPDGVDVVVDVFCAMNNWNWTKILVYDFDWLDFSFLLKPGPTPIIQKNQLVC